MSEPEKCSVYKNPLLYGCLAFFIVLFITQFITYQKHQFHQKNEQQEIEIRVSKLKVDLQNVLGQSFNATQTLAFIIEHYGIPNNFDSVAQLLLNSNKAIDALELVNKEGVITHVYPKKGNEVIGMNILNDPDNKFGAKTTLERQDYFTAGPIYLKQGGSGIIGRRPLYKKGQFNGFVAAVVRLSTVINAARLNATDNKQFSYQLVKINPDKTEETFYASKSISKEGVTTLPLTTSKGEWKLYVYLNNDKTSSSTILFGVLGLLLSMVCGVLSWFLIRQPVKLNTLVKEKTALLKDSTDRYKSLIDGASDGIFLNDFRGNILDVNPYAIKMFGYTKEEFLNKKLIELITTEETVKRPIRFSEMRKGKTIRSERRLIKKDGTLFYGEVSAKMLDNNTIIGIVRDITERKELELIAEENLIKFSKAYNNRFVGMVIKDHNNNFVDANPYFLDLIGYSLEDIKGRSINELGLIDKEDTSKTNTAGHTLSNSKKVDKIEVDLIAKDGDTLHLIASIEPFEYLSETFTLSMYVDQTKAKRSNLEIIQSEKKYKQFTERISDAFVAFDQHWCFTDINAKAAKIAGLDPNEILGKNIWLEFPTFKDSEAYAIFKGAMIKQVYTHFEQYHEHVDLWIEHHLYPSHNGLSIFFRDITHKKREEQEKQQLISIIENSPGFMGLATLTGEPLFLNDAGKKMIDLPSNYDITNSKIFDYFEENYKEIILNEHLPAIMKKGLWTGEVPLKNLKTNKIIPLEFSAFLIKDKKTNNPIAIGSVGFDLTERKKNQREILELKSKMDAAVRIGKIGYWHWDMNGTIVEWSKEMYAIHEINPNTTITPDLVRESIYYEDLHLMNNILEASKGEDHSKPGIYRILLNDKTFKYVLATSEVVYDIDENPIVYRGTAMDITQNVLSELALKESQEKFSKAFDNKFVGMLIIDENDKVIEANTTVSNLLDVKKEDLIGTKIMDSNIVHLNEFYSKKRHKIIAELQEKGKISNEEFKLTLKNGQEKTFLVFKEILKIKDELKVLVTLIDDTKRKETAEILASQFLELQKTNSELDSFVYSASHELRAPLSSVLGLIQLIQMEDVDPKLYQHLSMMEKSIERLDDFIKDIIEYSRNKHIAINLEPINFTTLIELSIENLWYLDNTRKINIEINVDDNIHFVSDSKRISVLLNNFISNAIKYHDISNDNATIWVNVKTTKKEAVLIIRDNGVGIAEDQLEKIFEMFYRVSSKVIGSGIGLFIVKEVLSKLKGTIDVQSIINEGSTFTIKIPNESSR
ncbi:PAS domain S-box protein [Maribacter ulvicola]|uniref:histidine kinase n=1 Tax=Maribacter ulvicola TaxID=228959 RepID=A0A1N6PFG1_9FLAO|nr:PAS domain S-box protein [Maribacter ulvicola]SIQ02959.1 PAS domain S-box-containing protein [Maribacter ulvicola]